MSLGVIMYINTLERSLDIHNQHPDPPITYLRTTHETRTHYVFELGGELADIKESLGDLIDCGEVRYAREESERGTC